MRPLRWLIAAIFAVAWAFTATPAYAAGDDTVEQFDVSARLDAEGYLQVSETIVLRFGADSGRHGLQRTLTVREPDRDAAGNDTGQDMLLKVDEVSVTSPSGAPDQVQLTYEGQGTRTEGLRIRVGDPNQTVSSPTATYVISYRVLGLVRSPGGVDQLYWDLTGAGMPQIVAASAHVVVPGGAQQLFCSAARPGATKDCATATRTADGTAQFAASDIAPGEVMTIGVGIKPGMVANHTPILEPDATKANAEQLAVAGAFGFWSLVLSTLAALVVPFIGWRRIRRDTADFRFADLPPGVLPAAGQSNQETRSDPRIEIPVAFSPPALSVSEAGYLADGKTEVRDTAATLVSLAVQGAVRLNLSKTKSVELVDRSRASGRIEKAVLRALFPNKSKGNDTLELGQSWRFNNVHSAVTNGVELSSRQGQWWAREPVSGQGWLDLDAIIKAVVGGVMVIVVAAIAVVFLGTFGVGVVLVAAGTIPFLVVGFVTWLVVRAKRAKGQRSGVGRALTDQVVGFRTYLATAEAEQLQFEEGEDIFSKYLPWAIAFGLTERWTQVCRRLVDLGRLPAEAPAWYAGPGWDLSQLTGELNDFGNSVDAASTPISSGSSSSYSSSDSGFGSSSSAFDGGGFSGGGGGGGDLGSW
jgi:uncharacterized membrane protein YgcG